jgi:hypothetical protein
MLKMIGHKHNSIKKHGGYHQPLGVVRLKEKSSQAKWVRLRAFKAELKKSLLIVRKSTRRDIEKAAMFAAICKSDSFTVDAAYKDFASVPLKSKNL